jgi:hypothetical protein
MNHALNAVNAIQAVNNVAIPPTTETLVKLKALCQFVRDGYELEVFPDKDDSMHVTGEWMSKQINDMFLKDPALLGKTGLATLCQAQTAGELQAFASADPRMPALLLDVVNSWAASAGQYEANRVASATEQMTNDGHTPAEISALIANPGDLRQYIQQKRTQFISTLNELQRRSTSGDLREMLTVNEKALLSKHTGWLAENTTSMAEHMPNDNSTPYGLLILEILIVIWSQRSNKNDTNNPGSGKKPGIACDLLNAYSEFIQIAAAMFARDGQLNAVAALRLTGSFTVHGANVGNAIREYFTDPVRWALSGKAVLDPKLQLCTQRTANRFLRLAAVTQPIVHPYSIMNLNPTDAARLLVTLHDGENNVQHLLTLATALKSGNTGFSLAKSMTWLFVLGRFSLFEPAWGRNDLSVPRLLETMAGMPTNGLGDLVARDWAVPDYTGMLNG